MRRYQWVSTFLLAGLIAAPSGASAREGLFVGADLGVSEPTNDNYRGHVQTGASGSPFVGYMFNDYLGLELQGHIIGQPPDNDHRTRIQNSPYNKNTYITGENKWTTIGGATFGPRLQLPLGEMVDLYVTGQGGGFKGMGGRLNQWAPGFSVGGGLDFNLTENLALGLFGRWNRAYMSPHPYELHGAPGVVGEQPREDWGPEDAQWATGGLAIKYSFGAEAVPPPPPPPPPAPAAKVPPPPPAPKKKMVLRDVHFDYDKADIRSDAKPILDEAVSVLKDGGEAVIVQGHTDSRGSDAYNMRLSRRRADAVRSYLASHGIKSSRIRTVGLGESKPVASNATEDGRSQNRRVELHLD